MGGNKQTGLRQWATPLSASGRPAWHGRLPTAIYFIPWHRYLPPGSFAMAIVSQSEVFSPRRVYERVAKWYYFLAQLRIAAVTASSGSQTVYGGEKRGLSFMRTVNPALSHMQLMYNQTAKERESCNWNDRIISWLSVSQRGSRGVHGHCARALTAACCKIIVLILIRIKGKNWEGNFFRKPLM